MLRGGSPAICRHVDEPVFWGFEIGTVVPPPADGEDVPGKHLRTAGIICAETDAVATEQCGKRPATPIIPGARPDSCNRR